MRCTSILAALVVLPLTAAAQQPEPGLFRAVREGIIGCRSREAVAAANDVPPLSSSRVEEWRSTMTAGGCTPAFAGNRWRLVGINMDRRHAWMQLETPDAGGLPTRLYFRIGDLRDEQGREPWIPGDPPPKPRRQ